MRSPEISESKTGIRILVLGDSCSFGYGIADYETYPAVLQDILAGNAATASSEVINAAVPGYTSWQCLRFLERDGLKLAPNIVIMGFGFNDSDDMYGCSDMEVAEVMHPWWWSDALYHTALGQVYFALRLALLSETKPSSAYDRPRLTLEEFKGAISSLCNRCNEQRICLILIVWPMRGQVCREDYRPHENRISPHHMLRYLEYQDAIRAAAQNYKVALIDGSVLFNVNGASGLFVDALHPGAKGARIIARAVADEITSVRSKVEK